MNSQPTLRVSTVAEERNHPILGLLFLPLFSSVLNESPLWYLLVRRVFLLFWWWCLSFKFLIYNIKVTSSPTLTYYNIFLFNTASFHFLIYNIKIILYPTLMIWNLFLFTSSCFTPFWYVSIKILIGGVNCC